MRRYRLIVKLVTLLIISCFGIAPTALCQGILLAAAKHNGKWGFIDVRGNWRIPATYTYCDAFSEGRARVKQGGKWGYIDVTGGFTVLLQYEDARPYSLGLAPVKFRDGWGYINLSGDTVLRGPYDDARCFRNGFARVRQYGRWGFLTPNGEWALNPQYEHAWWFSDGFAAVQLDGRFGYIQANGEWLVRPRFDFAGPFSEGLAVVHLNGLAGTLNQLGKWNFKPRYLTLSRHHEGRFTARDTSGLWVLLNTQGQRMKTLSASWVGPFYPSGLAAFTALGQYGYIDRFGKVKTTAGQPPLGPVANGYCSVYVQGRYGYFNESFKLVLGADYEGAGPFHDINATLDRPFNLELIY